MHRSKQHLYSITSSAIESNPGGTSMPGAGAVHHINNGLMHRSK